MTTTLIPDTPTRVEAVINHDRFEEIRKGPWKSVIRRANDNVDSVEPAYLLEILEKVESLLGSWDTSAAERVSNLESQRQLAIGRGWFKHFVKSHSTEASLLQQPVTAAMSDETMQAIRSAISLGYDTAREHRDNREADKLNKKREAFAGRVTKVQAYGLDFSDSFMNDDPVRYGIIANADTSSMDNAALDELDAAINAFFAYMGDTPDNPNTERKLKNMGLAEANTSTGKSNRGKGRRHR